MSRISKHALLLLPLVLPFEAPLFPVGPLVVTSAELGLYLVLGAWAAGLALAAARAAARDGWRAGAARVRGAFGLGAGDALGRAVALWLAVVAVSALAAPVHRAAALKFALRSTSGVLLFFAARDIVRGPADARRLTVAAVVGAALAAGSALLELALPDAHALWRPFRPVTFDTLGLPRASGVFAYPTIAAMYLEAALPLALCVPLARRRAGGSVAAADRAGWPAAASLALGALLVAALLLSATRSALAGAVVASGALLALGWRAGRGVRVAAAGGLALVALAVAGTFVLAPDGPSSDLARRLLFWRDTSWYGVRYAFDGGDRLTMTAGAVTTVGVRLRNTGQLAWAHDGPSPVLLSYHWETADTGAPRVGRDGKRTSLPADVAPGGELHVDGAVEAPGESGRYRLRWDLVREQMTWFSERDNNDTGDQIVEVVADDEVAGSKGAAAPQLEAGTLEYKLTPSQPSRQELWRAATLLWRRHPLLGVGPDNFRRRYPEVIHPPRGQRPYEDERMHANNFYLETLADLGLAGVAALALLALALGRAVRANAGAAAGRGGDALLALAWGVGAATFFVHGLLDYFLEFTPTYGLFWLSIALAGDRRSAATATPAPPDSTR
jgi:O-antigen ligase